MLGTKGAAAFARYFRETGDRCALNILNLRGTFIQNEGMISLCEGLKTNKSLLKLDLGANQISRKGMDAFCWGWACPTSLKFLNLSENPLTNAMKAFSDKILSSDSVSEKGYTLSSLNLTKSKLGFQEISQIISGCRRNYMLKELILDHSSFQIPSNIQAANFKFFSETLMYNHSLRVLSLNHC